MVVKIKVGKKYHFFTFKKTLFSYFAKYRFTKYNLFNNYGKKIGFIELEHGWLIAYTNSKKDKKLYSNKIGSSSKWSFDSDTEAICYLTEVAETFEFSERESIVR